MKSTTNGKKVSCRPNFKIYPGQCTPQGAYIQINQFKEIASGWNPELGGALPEAVWNERTIRFNLSPRLMENEIASIVATYSDELLALIEMTEIIDARRRFTEEARELYLKLAHDLDQIDTEYTDCCDDVNCQHCYGQV